METAVQVQEEYVWEAGEEFFGFLLKDLNLWIEKRKTTGMSLEDASTDIKRDFLWKDFRSISI